MGQTLEVNHALVRLLDYQLLKSNAEKIIVACAVSHNADDIPVAKLHDNSQEFTLYGIDDTQSHPAVANGKSFKVTSPKQNLSYVLSWLRNVVCDKKYHSTENTGKYFFLKFNIYRYCDFLLINEMLQNILLPREHLGLCELLLNIIEHDVFKDYQAAKSIKFRSGTWLHNVGKHITIKPIKVLIKFNVDKIIFNISHQAEGFHQKILSAEKNTLTGRGINLCKYLYFDSINFFDHSRKVIAITYRV